ncbi:hypothetical protein T01_1216 [Trichinella spiralis]|uniref:Uncharacterized protein n=1 Tax=Trichinella spiralis TaxID=6334 RepID=A0A0V1BTQ0_TRISP|nr:hypothetical protein T01_1216 [Trichinella spiralis]
MALAYVGINSAVLSEGNCKENGIMKMSTTENQGTASGTCWAPRPALCLLCKQAKQSRPLVGVNWSVLVPIGQSIA